jgi:hypothetical protein
MFRTCALGEGIATVQSLAEQQAMQAMQVMQAMQRRRKGLLLSVAHHLRAITVELLRRSLDRRRATGDEDALLARTHSLVIVSMRADILPLSLSLSLSPSLALSSFGQ